jgi:hypothetical protein
MSSESTTSTNQVSYLNIMISEKGLSEFSHGKRLIFIPKEQVQSIEIKFGTRAERPLMQMILGVLLAGLGIVGFSFVLTGGLRGLRWGLGFIVFGGLGVFCLYEALKKGYYLQIISTNDTRKLVFSGAVQKAELSQFLTKAVQFGYNFQNSLNDKSLI